MNAIDVCVVGHSYIRRLKEYCARTGTGNLDLDPCAFNITFRGKGGLKSRRCDSRSELLCFDIVPDIVFLQIGENDIAATTNSKKLAEDIISIAQYLCDGVGVRLVIIGQLIRRMQFASCRYFNITVIETNQHLKQLSDPLCSIHYWSHRGFWNDLHYLGPDGVHLLCTPDEDQPMRKYRRSIRNAVILLSKLIRPV
ncbi:uncharacterized protein LOC125676148 [Ostrea edulis]|uniref:uncharacterized protein LOC125676148 n=1 Tax=Ostrea edulis TaxID=37623 RepID=UPI0024AFB931|nr:uncharacterized protein LOC125676148 [Ostrea edulis]